MASAARLQRLFSGSKPALLLERAPGAHTGADAGLWDSGMFQGQVFPDLPVAGSWLGLLQAALRRRAPAQGPGPPAKLTANSSHAADPHGVFNDRPWSIQTVAAQVRSKRAIEERMLHLTDAADDSEERPTADALLCLSGSHPVRRLPGSDRWLMSSFDILRAGTRMRQQGRLPAHVSLWAVENPLTNDPCRLHAKVEAGAEVIVTQPPLVWSQFESWFDEIHRQGLTQQARLAVGMPMVTSPGNLRFWATLCDAWGLPGLEATLLQFEQAQAAGKPQLQDFCIQWNTELLRKVQELPGISALHVMPLTKSARTMAKQLLS